MAILKKGVQKINAEEKTYSLLILRKTTILETNHK